MEYINRVEISGQINKLRVSERGTNFIMLKQLVVFNGVERMRLYEVLISADRQDLIQKIALDKNVKITGFLTVFHMKKDNTHKMLVEATGIEIL